MSDSNNRRPATSKPKFPKPNFGSNERKRENIRGHDAALHHFQRNDCKVTVFLNNAMYLSLKPSHAITGNLTQYDAYTVTLEVQGMSNPLIIFKGNIGGITKSDR